MGGRLLNHRTDLMPASPDRRAPKRLVAISLLAAIALVLGFAVTTAQDATPDQAAHPLIGTWLVDTDADDPADAPEVGVVSADGGYVAVDAEGATTLGVWEATGERTANLTITSPMVTDNGTFGGTFVLRAEVEVDPSGDSFTGTYTFQLVWPDGSHTGEHGPGNAQGTRLEAEPVGTPVGSLSEFYEGEAEATPAD